MQIEVELDRSTNQVWIGLGYSSGLTQVYCDDQVVLVHQFGLHSIDLGPLILAQNLATNAQAQFKIGSILNKLGYNHQLSKTGNLVVVGSSAYQTVFGLLLVGEAVELKWHYKLNSTPSLILQQIEVDSVKPLIAHVWYKTGSHQLDSVSIDLLSGSVVASQSSSSGPTSARWSNYPNSIISSIFANRISSVPSIGTVLGDRQTMMKYINPNLVAITTGSATHPNRATVDLVDQTSGLIISKLTLSDIVANTVKLVVDQHRVIISAKRSNQLGQATIIYSIELYQTGEAVHPISRSFISPDGLQIAQTTNTNNKITTTNPLCMSTN